jgi:hypothetical protein
MAIAETTGRETELAQDLGRLVRLVEEHRVEEARLLAPELAAKWPDSRDALHWARVLEPPKVIPNRPGPPGRSFKRDYAWLREHAAEYPGCWIATYEDRFIAAAPDLAEVLAKIKASLDTERQMAHLHYQPPVAA